MNLKNLYEGLSGGAVTVALTVTGLIGQRSAGTRGLATAFVASVGILGALWITISPEPSSKTVRIFGLFIAAMYSFGVYWGGWFSGWLYGAVGWFLGMAAYGVLTRVTRFS